VCILCVEDDLATLFVSSLIGFSAPLCRLLWSNSEAVILFSGEPRDFQGLITEYEDLTEVHHLKLSLSIFHRNFVNSAPFGMATLHPLGILSRKNCIEKTLWGIGTLNSSSGSSFANLREVAKVGVVGSARKALGA